MIYRFQTYCHAHHTENYLSDDICGGLLTNIFVFDAIGNKIRNSVLFVSILLFERFQYYAGKFHDSWYKAFHK